MKSILAPVLAIGLLTASCYGASEKLVVNNQADVDQLMTRKDVLKVHAFWPGKRSQDPTGRIIEFRNTQALAIFKDPEDNEQSVVEAAEEGYLKQYLDRVQAANTPEMQEKQKQAQMAMASNGVNGAAGIAPISVLLDTEGRTVCEVMGTNVPASPRECVAHTDAMNQMFIDQLDPATPGLEEIRDFNAAGVQYLLNALALKGPEALESAKKNPIIVKLLDQMYESSQKYAESHQKYVEEMEKLNSQQEAVEKAGNNAAGKEAKDAKIEKRHNMKGHHHHKSSNNKNN
ncbi:hypothetical protein BG004_004549 [Podila humilis]|nr:hypothetical protein BG004_004549 [Podila humilis]